MFKQTEIAVIGGGPGGICAALAAARQGKETILVTDRPVLGGNSSSEIRVWTRGATGAGNIYGEEMGIWGEIKLRNLYLNPEGNPVIWDDVLLEQVLEQEKLTLLLNTHITDVELGEGGRIGSVSGFQMGSEQRVTLEAEYFIDATGDATLGAMTGLPYQMGKENRDVYGESFAPETAEQTTFGNTIFFFTKREEHPVAYMAPDFAYSMDYVEELLGKGGRIVNERMDGCDYWWFETGGMLDTITDSQKIALELKRLVLGVWNYIKNSGKFDADYLTLSWEGNLPGKRESRRMVTKTVLTQKDVLGGGDFPDAAFYGGWYLDFHPSDGIYTDEDYCTQIPVHVYQIPLGCLFHPDRSNLLFAGRNIGVSHVAFASTRIMNTCALSGQAAGTLAAFCTGADTVPDRLAPDQIRKIQECLMREDMMIPGMMQQDKDNLAVRAQVIASSTEQKGTCSPCGTFSLAEGGMLVLPSPGLHTEFLLEAGEDTELTCRYDVSDLPSRLAQGTEAGCRTIRLTRGENWIDFYAGEQDGQDGQDARGNQAFLTIAFEPNEQVSFATSKEQLTGFLLGRKHQARYEYPCLRLSAADAVYAPDAVVNGFIRPWGGSNVWISGKEERPHISLCWEEPVQIREVVVFFNPDLSRELNSSRAAKWDDHHMFEPRTGMPPELVKEAVLYGIAPDGTRTALARIKDNWKRRVAIRLTEAVTVREIRLEIISTYGAERAEVFEINVF